MNIQPWTIGSRPPMMPRTTNPTPNAIRKALREDDRTQFYHCAIPWNRSAEGTITTLTLDLRKALTFAS